MSDRVWNMLFSQILGQERAKAFLAQVMARDKIPHAYLFTGIAGIGKESTASALVTALNCLDPQAGDGCGRCRVCRTIQAKNYPDFLILAPDGQNIKIDQIRSLTHQLGFAPVAGRFRLSFIQRAEKMTEEAANSFLKTLEEPPPRNIFILSATEPLDLLPTIVSRCQRVPFQPLSANLVQGWLMDEKGAERDRAILAARLSGGSLGTAIQMLEGDYLEKRSAWLAFLMHMMELPESEDLDAAFACADENRGASLGGSQDGKSGLPDMLRTWESWYRDLLVAKTGAPDALLMNVDFSHNLKKKAQTYSIKHLSNCLFLVNEAQRELVRNRNVALVLENTVLRLKALGGARRKRQKGKMGIP
jgi:DNA polymerase-3 subunit delta'